MFCVSWILVRNKFQKFYCMKDGIGRCFMRWVLIPLSEFTSDSINYFFYCCCKTGDRSEICLCRFCLLLLLRFLIRRRGFKDLIRNFSFSRRPKHITWDYFAFWKCSSTEVSNFLSKNY